MLRTIGRGLHLLTWYPKTIVSRRQSPQQKSSDREVWAGQTCPPDPVGDYVGGAANGLAGAHGNRTHQEPVSKPLTGFEDRTEHQQRKRSLKRWLEAACDCKRRSSFYSRGARSSIPYRSIVLSRQNATDSGLNLASVGRPVPLSAVLSGCSGFIHGEFQAHPEGLGVTIDLVDRHPMLGNMPDIPIWPVVQVPDDCCVNHHVLHRVLGS
jgi:hypothetical protein